MKHIPGLMQRGVVALTVVLCAAPARGDLCDRSLAVRVNERGLDLVTKLLRSKLPQTIDVPAMDNVVMDWPLTDDDARLQMPAMAAKLKVNDLRAFMDSGALYIQGSFDVAAATPVTVLNPYASFGRADCQAALSLKGVELQLGAQLDNENNRTRVYVVSAKVSINNQTTSASIEGCTLGSILASVAGMVKGHLITAAEKAISSMAKGKIPPLLEEKLDTTLQLQSKTEGLAVGVKVDALTTDAAGVSALISASLQSTSTAPATCLAGLDIAPPPVCTAVTPTLKPGLNAMFAAGLSEALLQRVLHSLWSGGRMCLDSKATRDNPLIGTDLTKLASGLGLPPSAELDFQVRLAQPPSVKFGGTTSGITIELTGLRVDLELRLAAGADPSHVGLELDGAVSALPWIDPETASLALDLRSIAVRRLELIGQSGPLGLDPARLQRFVSEVVLPMLQKKLEGQALSPTVVNGGGQFLIDLKQIEVGKGFAAAYVDAFVSDAAGEDPQPPETVLVEQPGPLVAPQLMRIVVTGNDNQTPSGLLRYRARIDEGRWTAPSYSRRVDVAVKGGFHIIEVAAVDLRGNTDSTPLQIKVVVDDVPPELWIDSRPAPMLSTSSAELVAGASDDRTRSEKIELQGELYRVPEGGGAPELVGTQPYRAGTQSIRFEGLQGGVYKLRVIARDEAGNVTSQDLGFTVDLGNGCTAAPGQPPPAATLLALLSLLSLALGLRLRRTR